MKPHAALALASALVLGACGGSGGASPTATEGPHPDATEEAVATALGDPRRTAAQAAEADDDPSLPGEYVDLQAIYGGPYPETAGHITGDVDYSAQGTGPPVGGPHWGSAACGAVPAEAPPFCGPAPWGIFREAWPAETLVHNLEHAGVVLWYNTDDQAAIEELEGFAVTQLDDGRMLVLAPYPEMADGTVAITVWSRREVMPSDDLDIRRLETFIDALYCRFDPEEFCGRSPPTRPLSAPWPD